MELDNLLRFNYGTGPSCGPLDSSYTSGISIECYGGNNTGDPYPDLYLFAFDYFFDADHSV